MKTLLRCFGLFAILGGFMLAGEPGSVVHVDLRDVPLDEAVKKVEEATGRRLELAASVAEGRRVNFVKSGTADEILGAFAATLEVAHSITLVPVKDSASLRLQPFKKSEAVNTRPVARGRRLSVDVLEGTVKLTGGQGRVSVRAGERSWVTSGGMPVPPVPVDGATLAPWRFSDALPSAGLEASIPVEARYTVKGYTPAGDPIVEYEVNGVKKVVIVENGELIVPVPVKIEKGSK